MKGGGVGGGTSLAPSTTGWAGKVSKKRKTRESVEVRRGRQPEESLKTGRSQFEQSEADNS